MYGVHPRLTVIDQAGDTFGLLFLNSAAQEISLTPAPAVIYRTIGGLLDLYMFLGSRPEQVVQQARLSLFINLNLIPLNYRVKVELKL